MKGFSIFLELLSCSWLRQGRRTLKPMRWHIMDSPWSSTEEDQWMDGPDHRPLTGSFANAGRRSVSDVALKQSGFLVFGTKIAPWVAKFCGFAYLGPSKTSLQYFPLVQVLSYPIYLPYYNRSLSWFFFSWFSIPFYPNFVFLVNIFSQFPSSCNF